MKLIHWLAEFSCVRIGMLDYGHITSSIIIFPSSTQPLPNCYTFCLLIIALRAFLRQLKVRKYFSLAFRRSLLKMVKKVREYKSGDFIFAKVKGYPAWPARVQRLNGKKYFVYFYGTGEIANLPPNQIFDYAENKDKFLSKSVKRKDFNDGVKQIDYDFANNVPLEDVVGIVQDPAAVIASANDSTINDTIDDSAIADTTADDSIIDTAAAVEDSDGAELTIDEGKKRKSTLPKTPAKTPKTPRGKKKEEVKEISQEQQKNDEEIISRSGRKIRPKRYVDEQTEENSTLPSPIPKKRRALSPDKESSKDKADMPKDKLTKEYSTVSQIDLEELKEPFSPADSERENILIAAIPSGSYVGIKLFESRPASFKNEAARLQWDKQAASNALTLKMQLEKGHITPQSISGQLVMDLNLTDEEKATLDKEREIEEKKSRVLFLKTEMKLIELDAKIKTCLSLEKADTELCLTLLDDLLELNVKPLMLLKHPTCLETVKRMCAYVGNTPSWDLSESEAIVFNKQAHKIRKQAEGLYKKMKSMYTTPEGLSFWEYFSERVLQFKKATAKLNADELLEMVQEPPEMLLPSAHTMKAAIDAANEIEAPTEEDYTQKETKDKKKPSTPAKTKKTATASTPSKALKRQSSRNKQDDKETEANKETESKTSDDKKTIESAEKSDSEPAVVNDEKTTEENDKKSQDKTNSDEKMDTETDSKSNESESKSKDADTKSKDAETKGKDSETKSKDSENKSKATESKIKISESKSNKNSDPKSNKSSETKGNKSSENSSKNTETKAKVARPDKKEDSNGNKESNNKDEDEKVDTNSKESTDASKLEVNNDNKDGGDSKTENNKDDGEPKAKRSRESKKTEAPPPRSPAKRKSKS